VSSEPCECEGVGCYRCCDHCNYDRHSCPGCGADLKHGIEMCADCHREHSEQAAADDDLPEYQCPLRLQPGDLICVQSSGKEKRIRQWLVVEVELAPPAPDDLDQTEQQWWTLVADPQNPRETSDAEDKP
jgi:hypothetical protein